MKTKKPFFNTRQDLYEGDEPCFYSPELLPWVSSIEENYPVIKQELLAVLNDPDKYEAAIKKFSGQKQKGWKQIELKIYGISYQEKINLFPETMAALSEIQGVSTIYFSLLESQSSVKPHVGDTDAFHRVHLGIEIPGTLPDCGIMVAGQQKAWEEGKCVVFNDVYHHSAWNQTSKRRIVLIIDVIREPLIDQQLYVNAGVRATLFYSRLNSYTFFLSEFLPRILQRAIHPVFHGIFYLIHRIRFGSGVQGHNRR